MNSGDKQNFFMSEKVNLRKKALCSTHIQNRNVDVHCVHEKLFISPILLHFPDTSENGIAYFFEKKRSFNNVLVFWQHLGFQVIKFFSLTQQITCFVTAQQFHALELVHTLELYMYNQYTSVTCVW